MEKNHHSRQTTLLRTSLQIDDDGNRQVFLNEIIDHRTTGHQVMQQDAFIMAKNGVR